MLKTDKTTHQSLHLPITSPAWLTTVQRPVAGLMLPLMLSAGAWANSAISDTDLEILDITRPSVGLSMTMFKNAGGILVDMDALKAVVQPWLGRQLDGVNTEALATAVGDHLRSVGHTRVQVVIERRAGEMHVRLENLSPTVNAYAKVQSHEPTLEVKAIRFEGSTVTSEQELQDAVDAWVGKSLLASELDAPAKAVTALLKSKGLSLAQAIVPPQSMADGVLHILVVEGTVDGSTGIDGILIKGVERTKPEVIAAIVSPGAPAGQPLRVAELESRLMLANELPGLKFQSSLKPGSKPGTTVVELKAQEEKSRDGTVYLDNHGSRYTGEMRLGVDASYYSPSNKGDLITVGGNISSGSKSVKFAWSRPQPRDYRLGGSMSATRTQMSPQIINAEYDGRTSVFNLFVQKPLLRSARETRDAHASLDIKNLDNNFEGMLFDSRKVYSLTAGMSGAQSSEDVQRQWSTSLVWGNTSLNNVSASLNPRLDTEGTFGKFNFDYRLTKARVRFAGRDDWSLRARAAGQVSLLQENLDNAEKYQLGGPDGVRGYPVGEGSGDSGLMGTLELGRSVNIDSAKAADFYMFVDAGLVVRNPVWTQSAEGSDGVPNMYQLHSLGVGLNVELENELSWRFVLANPVDNNPSQVNGLNTDGKKSRLRLWASGAKKF